MDSYVKIKDISGSYTKIDECLICYLKIKKKSSVTCKLCSNVYHFSCYEKLVEENSFYAMKCCHCQTRSLKFNMRTKFCCF